MAQLFPMNAADLGADDAPASLARTLLALPDSWTLLRHRQVGGVGGAEPVSVDLVLVHPEIGVALVDVGPRDPRPAVAALRDYLAAQRFGVFFPGDLPIVALSVPAAHGADVADRLAAAFHAAPLLSVADSDWADAVIELLLVPDDLAMAPAGTIGGVAASAMREEEPAWQPERRAMRPDPVPADEPMMSGFDRTPETDPWESHRAPSREAWPIAAAERRRGGLAAAGILGLCLVGGGAAGAAWQFVRQEPSNREAAVTPPPQEIEIPLSPPLIQHRRAPPPRPAPPPVPPARPVVLAAKPLAPRPPRPPVPTRVEPLPRRTEKAPALSSPPSVVPTPPSETTASATRAAAPTARPAPGARPQPAALVHMAAPRAWPEARAEPGRPPPETSDLPPIDAADLPPLDAPVASSEPAPDDDATSVAAPPATAAWGAPGPPVAFTAPPVSGAGAPSQAHECKPYTANSTLTGRNLRVQGIACLDSDGAWRLVSEVPIR
jgi:hypothetical protein